MHGASHEMGWRAGTENVIEIVGLGRACELISRNLAGYHQHMREMRRPAASRHLGTLHGRPDKRPSSKAAAQYPQRQLPRQRGQHHARCHEAGLRLRRRPPATADRVEVSSVLEAMAVPLDYAMGTLRFSVGRFTTAEEIDLALDEISEVVEHTPSLV